jgi:hypothetical protein
MSGPKLIEMRRRARAARLQKNRDLCDRCDAEYARLWREHRRLCARISALGGDPGKPLQEAAEISAIHRGLLDRGQDEEAGRRYPHQVAFARTAVEEARLALGGRIATLHERLKRARSEVEHLRSQRDTLAAAMEPAAQARIAAWLIPDPAGIDEQDVAALEQLECELNRLREHLANLPRAPEPVARSREVPPEGPQGRSLADWVKQRRAGPTGAVPEASQLSEGVRLLLQQAAAFEDPALWQEMQQSEQSFRQAVGGAAGDAERGLQTMRMESALTSARERKEFRAEVFAMLDQAAVFPVPEVEQEARELRSLLESGQVRPLAPFRSRLDTVLKRAEAAREHEARRRAVLESLQELGYHANEGLQTALAQGGRLLLQKEDQKDYAVEVVADAGLDRIQTAIVRFAADAEMTEDRRLRDREEEGHWCQDHAQLRQKLQERGWESAFVMQRPPGEHPVRVIVDKERAARESATRAAESRPRARTLPQPGHEAP